MTAPHDVVFLLDVDNTLLDNDSIIADLQHHLEREIGAASARQYWKIFEALRIELGYADYLGALQRYRSAAEQAHGDDPRLLRMSTFLIDYPFADRLYPRALDVVRRLNGFGRTVVFQPRKVLRSGLWDAACGRVLIYIHKEQMLESVQRHFPARHYVMVDDKLRILDAMKKSMGNRLTTVFPRQGHYALDPANAAAYPPADVSVERIGDLVDFDVPALLGREGGEARAILEKS